MKNSLIYITYKKHAKQFGLDVVTTKYVAKNNYYWIDRSWRIRNSDYDLISLHKYQLVDKNKKLSLTSLPDALWAIEDFEKIINRHKNMIDRMYRALELHQTEVLKVIE